MKEKIKIFPDAQSVAKNFSEYFLKISANRPQFNISLSGGSTPKIVFDYLADNYSNTLTWQNIRLFWGDERCVLPDDEDSNYKMTKLHLLDKIKISADSIHRILGENNPQDEAKRYASLLSNNLPIQNGWPVFDLIILGMGDDGHTASIFPNQMELLNSPKICEVAPHPASGQKRITITGKVINNAREVIFLVTGENKKQRIYEVLKETGDFKNYPAYYVNPASGNITWFIDQAAGRLLT